VTRLRKMMLEELQRHNYSEMTTRKYFQYVTVFARHFGKPPDQLGPDELRSYQAYLFQERKVTPGTAVNCVAALRFFFINLLFRWFVGLNADDTVWDATVFSENRDRLLQADVAKLFGGKASTRDVGEVIAAAGR